MSKHIPNERQKKAFAQVIKAIERAKKAGLVFYAKSNALVAYTKNADDYANQWDFSTLLSRAEGRTIPFLGENILTDSGADDYVGYMTKEDQKKYNPDKL